MGIRIFLVQKLVHEIRQAKATGKDYTLGDSDGLSLGVSATGSKSWHFRYSWVGKQKRMSFGTYPEVGLRQARALTGALHPNRTRTLGGIGSSVCQSVCISTNNNCHPVMCSQLMQAPTHSYSEFSFEPLVKVKCKRIVAIRQ